MITTPKQVRWVSDLMDEQQISLDDLVRTTGVEKRVIQAIVEQRFTPDPQQRDRVSRALGVDRHGIVWGHRCHVERGIHSPD